MSNSDRVNILLVDDQPAKLASYRAMLEELGENLLEASSAQQALECLLKNDVAILLVDVCMPDLDGFQLARTIREHPRFEKTAIIFISAIRLTDDDRLEGYRMGAVDYIVVPVVPEILRARVKIFAERFRCMRQLSAINSELDLRVSERTRELEAAIARLKDSEEQLKLAAEAADVGYFDFDFSLQTSTLSPRLKAMFGMPADAAVGFEDFIACVHPDDRERADAAQLAARDPDHQPPPDVEGRVVGRDDGLVRWVLFKRKAEFDDEGVCTRIVGTAVDVSSRKRAEEYQARLAWELDHRAKNALTLVQSIYRLTKAPTLESYARAIDGRVTALARVHKLLSESRWHGASLETIAREELAPYAAERPSRILLDGPDIQLTPSGAQCAALVLHEMTTNSVKYGALSDPSGNVCFEWSRIGEGLESVWQESGGPAVSAPATTGFGLKIVRASVEKQLRGSVEFDWRPRGLRCRFFVRTGVNAAASLYTVGPDRRDVAYAERLDRPRVLILEEESLIAPIVQEALEDSGMDVVDTVGNLADAMRVARRQPLSAAVLDATVGGRPVDPLAEYLVAKGIPFVFVTRPGHEQIDHRFAQVPVIRKPLDFELLREKVRTLTLSADRNRLPSGDGAAALVPRS